MNLSTDLPNHYRYRYTLALSAGYWRHSYELIGRWGGLHLHVTDFGEKRDPVFVDRYSAGLETHYRQPPIYMANRPPSHDKCHLLEAPCWHDGTSLYAMEHLVPMFDGVCHDLMFRQLAHDADRYFKIFTHPEGDD